MTDSDNEDFIIETVEHVDVSEQKQKINVPPTTTTTTTGAIKKTSNYSQALSNNLGGSSYAPQLDFSQFSNFKNKEYLPSNFQSTVELINSGIRVCVILRGAPGSGKSWLANKIVEYTVKKSHRNYIFSSDDYFMDPDGNYVRFSLDSTGLVIFIKIFLVPETRLHKTLPSSRIQPESFQEGSTRGLVSPNRRQYQCEDLGNDTVSSDSPGK